MDLDVGPDDFGGSDEGSHYMSSKQGLGDVFEHVGDSVMARFERACSKPCPEREEPTETLLTPLEVLKAGLLCLTSQYEQMGAQLMVLCEALCLLEDGMQSKCNT